MPRAVRKSDQVGENSGRGDQALAALAARQHGLVSRGQLRELGYGTAAIRYRASVGRLHAVHTGVFTVGHPELTVLGRYMAAILACGDGALLSHHSAARFLGLLSSGRTRIDVTVPGRGPDARPGIALHRRQALHRDDRAEVDGFAITSVARTLRDLAAVLPPRRLQRAAEEAERLRVLDLRALEAVYERRRGRAGSQAIARLLKERVDPPWTRSTLERHFLALTRQAGLPAPVVNGRLLGFEVDFHWPEHRLVVEVDGFAYHRTRASFEGDRRRDAKLSLAGQRVLRLTQRRLQDDSGEALADVRSLLASPPSPRAGSPAG